MFMVIIIASHKHSALTDRPERAGGNTSEGTQWDIQVLSSAPPHTGLLYMVPVHMHIFFCLQVASHYILAGQMIKSHIQNKKITSVHVLAAGLQQ
jgi:hypothetical protein